MRHTLLRCPKCRKVKEYILDDEIDCKDVQEYEVLWDDECWKLPKWEDYTFRKGDFNLIWEQGGNK